MVGDWANTIPESPLQFENRIMARVYVRRITRSTTCPMYQKSPFCLPDLAYKVSSVASYGGFTSIKIDYSDYPKSLISRINEVYVFSIKYRYSDILLKKTLTSFKPFV